MAIAVEVTVEARALRLRVRDTGVGIAADDLPHVFERFYRARSAATRHVIGSGLGLAIVKGLVEALGGGVEVASEPGAGSTFTVRLPLDRPPPHCCGVSRRAAP